MYQMEPSPNLGRRYQIFQIWIRPVQPPTAKFALRLALYELNRLVKDGIPSDAFATARAFVAKYINILMRTQSAQLGFAIDGMYYDRPDYGGLLKQDLAKLTVADVNRAIRRYLRPDQLIIVAVAKNGEELKQQLAGDDPSPMTYNSPKPASITDIDKIVEKWPLHLKLDAIEIMPVDRVFQ
jgi:zinc protease